ncbi:MAG TPA: DUF2243 domain-containing protein [Acidimicrobiia bacterium]|nr:DUF2243 domain-containing protein [Acidimicrobiia bacterium]
MAVDLAGLEHGDECRDLCCRVRARPSWVTHGVLLGLGLGGFRGRHRAQSDPAIASSTAQAPRLDGRRLGIVQFRGRRHQHHILQIHRVRPAAEYVLLYDLGFLLLGALLVIGGLRLQRSRPRHDSMT